MEAVPSLSFSKKTFAPQKKVAQDDVELPDEIAYETFSRTVEQVSQWLRNSSEYMYTHAGLDE